MLRQTVASPYIHLEQRERMPCQKLTLSSVINLEKVKHGKYAFRHEVELILALVFNHLTLKEIAVKLIACLPLSLLRTNSNVIVLMQILQEN